MSQQINYADDLYYVHSMVKSLRSGMSLDLDSELFRDKITEDILFIDGVFLRLLTALKQNRRLIKRREYLRMMLRSLKGYDEFLKDTLSGSLLFGKELAPLEEKLRSLRSHVHEISREIRELLEEANDTVETGALISDEEYRFLFEQDEGPE